MLMDRKIRLTDFAAGIAEHQGAIARGRVHPQRASGREVGRKRHLLLRSFYEI